MSFFVAPFGQSLTKLSFSFRYTVLIKTRGIIKAKGYILRALRDIRGKRAF